jgi:hypothetical protein
MENEICKNCGRSIGRLEQAFVYKEQVVCKQCHKFLSDETQQTLSAPRRETTSSNARRVNRILLLCVMMIILLSVFIVVGKLSLWGGGNPLRDMTIAAIQQFVQDWTAGNLPGMDVALKEQRDKLAKAESELNDIAKREYEVWNTQLSAPERHSYFAVSNKSALIYAEELIEFGAASNLLIAQVELVKKLENEIPAGPSLEAWEKYESKYATLKSLTNMREIYIYGCPPERGIDRTRSMFYKTFGKPDRIELFEGEYGLYYRCRDGRVKLTSYQEYFDHDCVCISPQIRVF